MAKLRPPFSREALPDPSETAGWSWSDAPDWSGEWPEEPPKERYIRGTILAEGGMGAVYIAEDPLLRRQLALKVVRGTPDSQEARRLLREARITAALDHPGVVGVLDAGTDDAGRPWFAMPLVHGRTLRATMDATGNNRRRCLHALIGAARVLGHAHRTGIVHRDVKPANLMVSNDGRVVVLDWGIARPESASSEWDALLTSSDNTVDEIIGTPSYMSPEQALGGAVTVRSDVWSLGVCLYEVLEGAPPFVGASPQEILKAVVHGPIPRLPPPLGDVLAAALQRQPEQRLAHGDAFADALEAALRTPTTPQPPRRPHHGLLALALGIGLGAGLMALAPSDLPPPLFAASLARVAIDAARSADRPTAELVSAAGLLQASPSSPTFRGVLSAVTLGVQHESTVPKPNCQFAAVHPNASALACTVADETYLYDLPSGEVRWRRPVRLQQLVWSGDTLVGHLATDSRVGVLDWRTGASRGTYDGFVGDIRLFRSPRADLLIALMGQETEIYSIPENRHVRIRERHPGARVATVLPDGRVASLGKDGLALWSLDDETPRVQPRSVAVSIEDEPFHLATAANGAWLAEGSLAGRVRWWNITTESQDGELSVDEGMIRGLAISDNGTFIACIDERGRAWVWSREAPGNRIALPGTVDHIAFAAEDRLVTIGTDIRTYFITAPPLRGVLPGDSGISGLDWAHGYLAAGLGSGQVRRWLVEDGTLESIDFVDGQVAKDVAIGPNGEVLAASLHKTQPTKILWGPPEVPVRWCRRVAWASNGTAACVPLVRGPDVFGPDRKGWPTLSRSTANHVDLEPTHDRRELVLLDEHGDVFRITENEPPQLVPVVSGTDGHTVASTRGDDEWVLVGSPTAVSWWRSGATAPTFTRTMPSTPLDLAISPDGRHAAIGLRDGDVLIYNLSDASLVAHLVGHGERVASIAFSPDGALLATGSWDETIRLWHVDAWTAPVEALANEANQRWGIDAAELLAGLPSAVD